MGAGNSDGRTPDSRGAKTSDIGTTKTLNTGQTETERSDSRTLTVGQSDSRTVGQSDVDSRTSDVGQGRALELSKLEAPLAVDQNSYDRRFSALRIGK